MVPDKQLPRLRPRHADRVFAARTTYLETPRVNANVYALLRSRYADSLDRTFLRVQDRSTWTYRDIDDLSARYAGVLADRGVKAGDRAVVQVAKSPQAVALYLACLRSGVVYVPLNTAYTPVEVEYFLQDAEPGILICEPSAAESLGALAARYSVPNVLTLDPDGKGSLADAATGSLHESVIERAADDIAAMLYTSGTTGRSKGAMLTCENLTSNALALHRAWGWVPGDVLLHTLPIFHVHGLFVALHCAMLNASEVIFLSRFDTAETTRLLPESTVMMGVPTYYARLLADPNFGRDACGGMRLFTSGSAPLSENVHREFEARSGHVILERYGMTEAGMITSNPYEGERVAGTVGYPLADVDIRVVDDDGSEVAASRVGNVEVRGPNVFPGYWRMPDKTAAEFRSDGFFRTGDVGSLSQDGRLSLAGRAGDMIICGGFNVYPKEVELALEDIEGVAEVAVVGLPHPNLGEGVVACVVAEGAPVVTPADLREALSGRLASFKQPREYVFVDELPRTAMGKVRKADLRARYAGLLTGNSHPTK